MKKKIKAKPQRSKAQAKAAKPKNKQRVAKASTAIPVGAIVAYFPTDSVPNGWLICNGQSLSEQDFPELYQKLKSKSDDGLVHLPNLCGLVLVGAGQSADKTTYITGNTGGSAQVSLTLSQMPRHTHYTYFGYKGGGGNPNSTNSDTHTLTGNKDYTSYTGGDPNKGEVEADGEAYSNMQPYMVANYIIFAGEDT